MSPPKLAAIRRSNPDRDLFAEFSQPKLSQILAIFKESQTLAKNLTLRLITPGLKQVGNKLIECGTKVDIHNGILAKLTTTVNN